MKLKHLPIALIIFFFSIFFITGCIGKIKNIFTGQEKTPVKIESLKSVNVKDYFYYQPKRVYEDVCDDQGNPGRILYVTMNYDRRGYYVEQQDFILYDGKNTEEKADFFYDITDDTVTQIPVPGTDGNIIEPEQIILTNKQVKWDIPNGTAEITGLDETIQTKAGVFNNTIEITTVINNAYCYKYYYAEYVGLVLIRRGAEKSNWMDFVIHKQLIRYDQDDKNESNNLNNESENNGANSHNGSNISSTQNPDADKPSEMNYSNSMYGFSLKLPGWWKDQYAVRENDRDYNFVERIISFNYIFNNKEYCIFSIVVLKGNKPEEELSEFYYSFFGNNGNHTYVLEIGEDIDQDILDPKNKSQLETIQKMHNDLGYIAQSFALNN
ncbi:MAG: hypothetical protein PHZ11_09150 [Desulfitobacteriaceae bacterium]|nr:hypothetical protein [Desulfitobacteriaceae bacterium]MDD4347029.1 hypothetical protein [Desulfitobacteriaceae bacterium]MDD4401108.1 hypothetical protein [Desulfitobacteriaceae bacterium]